MTEKEGVEALNLEVEHQIAMADRNKTTRVEHLRAEHDAINGIRVYKHRSIILVYMLVSYSMLRLLSTTWPHFLTTLFWGVFMYFYIDFYGGLLHFVLDWEENLSFPPISAACLEFLWHHRIPRDITSQPFYEVVGALNTLATVKLCVTFAVTIFVALSQRVFMQSWTLIFAWGYLWAVVGQWSHRQAHTAPLKRPWWTVALQNTGILLDPRAHKAHHDAAFEEPHKANFGRTYPILHGRSGLLLEKLLNAVPNGAFWTFVWLFLTIFDVFIFSSVFDSTSRIVLSGLGQ